MKKKVIICQAVNGETENIYLDMVVEAISIKKWDYDYIRLPINFNKSTILQQIAAYRLLDVSDKADMVVAIGQMAGFVIGNNKVLISEKDIFVSYENKTIPYIKQAVLNMKKECQDILYMLESENTCNNKDSLCTLENLLTILR